MKTLQNRQELADMIRCCRLLVVQYGAASCLPCGAIREKLTEWQQAHPAVEMVYVPLEEYPDLAAGQSIFAAPAVLVYADGQLTVRRSGCFSLEEIFCEIGRYAALLEL